MQAMLVDDVKTKATRETHIVWRGEQVVADPFVPYGMSLNEEGTFRQYG